MTSLFFGTHLLVPLLRNQNTILQNVTKCFQSAGFTTKFFLKRVDLLHFGSKPAKYSQNAIRSIASNKSLFLRSIQQRFNTISSYVNKGRQREKKKNENMEQVQNILPVFINAETKNDWHEIKRTALVSKMCFMKTFFYQ